MDPITRKEMFLAAAGGQNVETPTPVTREEVFLDEIAKGGGSSLPSTETASAGDVLSLDDNKEPQWGAPSGGGGVTTVEASNEGVLNKTWQEINDAGFCVFKNSGEMGIAYNILVSVDHDMDGYYVTFFSGEDWLTFTASTANDYPVISNEP